MTGNNAFPKAVDDRPFAIKSTDSILIDVLENDLEGEVKIDRASLTISQFPSSGSAKIEEGKIVFKAIKVGEFELKYHVRDLNGLQSNEASVFIRVQNWHAHGGGRKRCSGFFG